MVAFERGDWMDHFWVFEEHLFVPTEIILLHILLKNWTIERDQCSYVANNCQSFVNTQNKLLQSFFIYSPLHHLQYLQNSEPFHWITNWTAQEKLFYVWMVNSKWTICCSLAHWKISLWLSWEIISIDLFGVTRIAKTVCVPTFKRGRPTTKSAFVSVELWRMTPAWSSYARSAIITQTTSGFVPVSANSKTCKEWIAALAANVVPFEWWCSIF